MFAGRLHVMNYATNVQTQLPVEVQEYILLFLCDRDWCTFRSVSRRWLHVYDLFEPSVLAPEEAHHNAAVLMFMCHRSTLLMRSVSLDSEHEQKRLLLHCIACRDETDVFRSVAELASRHIATESVQLQKEGQQLLETCFDSFENGCRALNDANLADISELRHFARPPPACLQIGCCYVMMVERRVIDATKPESWMHVKRLLCDPGRAVQAALNFDREEPLPLEVEETIRAIVLGPEADELQQRAHSTARFTYAQLLWLQGMLEYFPVHRKVDPIRVQLRKQEQNLRFTREVFLGHLAKRHSEVGSYVGAIEENRNRIIREESHVANALNNDWSNVQRALRAAKNVDALVTKATAPATAMNAATQPKGRVPLTLHHASFPTATVASKRPTVAFNKTGGTTALAKKKK